jgi:hypothetical protein
MKTGFEPELFRSVDGAPGYFGLDRSRPLTTPIPMKR